MLPTFVIGLREGLEAALIVGIIAAFLRQQGRRDLLRWVFVGVGAAVLLCVAVGATLEAVSSNLPQRQQEGLETVVGVLAVGMVTYMVVWMRQHSRELKSQLEGLAAAAIGIGIGNGKGAVSGAGGNGDEAGGEVGASGHGHGGAADGNGNGAGGEVGASGHGHGGAVGRNSDGDDAGEGARSRAGRAMVVMAFLAVLREGFETVVFLLAAFNESGSSVDAGIGALAGILLAVLLGYGIYCGGVRLNLSKFFRVTGIVLVFVAAGLVVTALHTAHEAGWLNVGQSGTVDLTWLVRPGSVQSALLTGMLGIQDHPVLIEVIGWLAYLVPVGLYVAWPPNRKLSRRTLIRVTSASAAISALATVVLVLAAPSAPASSPIPLHRTGSEVHDGLATDVYTSTRTESSAAGRPTQLTYTQVAALNGGRLPLGVRAQNTNTSVQVQYTDTTVVTLWVEPRTGRIIDRRSTDTVLATLADTQVGTVPLDKPVAGTTNTLPTTSVNAAIAAARHDLDTLDQRSAMFASAWIVGSIAAVALLILLGLLAKRSASAIS